MFKKQGFVFPLAPFVWTYMNTENTPRPGQKQPGTECSWHRSFMLSLNIIETLLLCVYVRACVSPTSGKRLRLPKCRWGISTPGSSELSCHSFVAVVDVVAMTLFRCPKMQTVSGTQTSGADTKQALRKGALYNMLTRT